MFRRAALTEADLVHLKNNQWGKNEKLSDNQQACG
jgi:hypothetical protein